MEIITLDKVLEISEALVKERGEDYVYSNPTGIHADACDYVHRFDKDGKPLDRDFDPVDVATREPGCHVGAVLINLGVNPEWFDDAEGATSHDIFTHLRKLNVFEFERSAEDFLNQFQNFQDIGLTWGESYKKALNGLNS